MRSKTVSVILKVKGTHFYAARKLYAERRLVCGALVSLDRDPDNSHDKNAVVVSLGDNQEKLGNMLGYVSRELAYKYAGLIRTKRIVSSKIFHAGLKKDYLDVKIQIIYKKNNQKSRAGLDLPGSFCTKRFDRN